MGEHCDVTGPRLMTLAGIARELSDMLGRPFRQIPVTFEDFRADVATSGVWNKAADHPNGGGAIDFQTDAIQGIEQ